MHIIEKITVDSAGRLLLTKLFKQMPREVLVAFDTRSKRLLFKGATNDDDPKLTRKVDEKNRVCLPKWIIEELGSGFYVCEESLDEHFVLPCKFIFIE